MNVQTLLLDSGHVNRPGTILPKVTGVVIHWTANEGKGADAVANRNYFNRKYVIAGNKYCEEDGKTSFRYASAHINVDDHQYTENIPWKKGVAEMGYHVGATSYIAGICNKLSTTYPNNVTIGIEICVNSDGNFQKAYANGVQVVAMVLKEHGLGIDALIRHYDVTGKVCPAFFVDNNYGQKYFSKPAADAYAQFRSDVQTALTPANPYYQVYQQGTLYNQYTTGQGAEDNARILFIQSGGKDATIYAANLDGTPLYTPSKHPEEFPQFVPTVNKERLDETDVRYVKLLKDTYSMELVWAPRKTVSEIVKEKGATYGFNFPFFWESNPIADCKIGNHILGIGEDKVGGAQMKKWHGFAWKNGQAVIGELDINDDYTDGFLVKTSPMLVSGGNAAWDYFREIEGTAQDIGRDANGNLVRAQRTFIGLDADGNLIVAAADGREGKNLGLTLEDMANFMISKGAVVALNGDGGASTVLADQTGSLGKNKGANERAVGHAILIYCKVAQPTPAPTPVPDAPKFYTLMYEGKQQGAYTVEANGETATKELYRQTKSPNIVLNNPDGTAAYSPSKHPEDFPDLAVAGMDDATQKAVYLYLKQKLGA